MALSKDDGRKHGGRPLKGELSPNMERSKPVGSGNCPSPIELARLKLLDQKAPPDGWTRKPLQFTCRRVDSYHPAYIGYIPKYVGVNLNKFTSILFTHINGGPNFVIDVYGSTEGPTLLAIAQKRGFNLNDYNRTTIRSET